MSRDYDVIILGSGPAGFSCAMQSAKFDKKALVVESHDVHLGGTWINTGTVPSKALREAAKTILEFNTQFQGEDSPKPHEHFRMKDLLQYKEGILERENQKAKDDLIKNEVDVVRGFGTLVDKHTIEVKTHIDTTQTYTADYILIGTGSSLEQPTHFSIDNNKILDYKSILNITHIPGRLVIVGTGVHALEYATTFAALGTRVSVLNPVEKHLSFLDEEINEMLYKILPANIRFYHNVRIEGVAYNALRTSSEIRFYDPTAKDRLQVIETEHILHLGSRVANTQGLGLTELGIETDDQGFIKTKNNNQTSADTVYAAGDVIGFPKLASASFSQGRMAACNMFDIPTLESPEQIPYAIYTLPEIAHIGITEQEARRQERDITVGRAYFKNIAKADMNNHQEGMLKLVFDTQTFKLLGVHIIGNQAANLIHLGQSVMAFGGDIRYFIRHVMNYPTLSEAYKIAAFNGVNRVYKAGVKYNQILEKEG